jgi:hypothetical protein
MAQLNPCKIPTISIVRVAFQSVSQSHNLLGWVLMMNRFIRGCNRKNTNMKAHEIVLLRYGGLIRQITEIISCMVKLVASSWDGALFLGAA